MEGIVYIYRWSTYNVTYVDNERTRIGKKSTARKNQLHNFISKIGVLTYVCIVGSYNGEHLANFLLKRTGLCVFYFSVLPLKGWGEHVMFMLNDIISEFLNASIRPEELFFEYTD